MSEKVTNVVIAGIGGQGVLKASDILADAAFRAGRDVKKSEIHGMSQRGGSVTSDVRFGEQVLSPMVPTGEADYLLVLTPDQLDTARPALREGGTLITSEIIDADALGNPRSLNVACLGALSVHLDIDDNAWRAAIHAALPEKVHQMNDEAFELGRRAAATE